MASSIMVRSQTELKLEAAISAAVQARITRVKDQTK